MVLLKYHLLLTYICNYYHLHSNMVLLKYLNVTLKEICTRNLHSNMVLLKLVRTFTNSFFAVFTFQYGTT